MSSDLADLPDIADYGKTPIASDAPAGTDASYDPEYEELQREIDKLSLATAARASLDWNLVTRLAASILSQKSKDLKVAAYLSEALTKTGQIEGLAKGTHILRDMVETYWEDLFPPKKRLRGRLNALEWWQERAQAAIEAYDAAPLPPQTVAAFAADLTALDKALADKADSAAPLTPLIEAVSRLPVQAAEPAQEATASPPADGPAPTGAPAASPAPAAAPATAQAAPAAAGSIDKAREQLASSLDTLFGASYALWQNDPASPVAYRLVRWAAWLSLTALPSAQNGKTMLPGPPASVRAALNQGQASGNALATLGNAESHVREFRFWLDLSRLSAEALRALGPAYAAALDAVETETALFLRRFPGLENLTFADGSPFADEKTRLWLSRLGKGTAALRSGQGGAAGGPDADDVHAVLDKAGDLAATNQIVAAATLLQGRIDAAPSGRLRLRWRIGLAAILLTSGNPEIARPIIDQILLDLDTHKLDDFDPDLTLEALLTARQGLAAAGDEAAKTRSREVLGRIIRLDPAQGLRLSGIS
ncbi:MAG: type VI secretion system protein TssA [Solidesulfovibrio sp.]